MEWSRPGLSGAHGRGSDRLLLKTKFGALKNVGLASYLTERKLIGVLTLAVSRMYFKYCHERFDAPQDCVNLDSGMKHDIVVC